MSGPLGRGTSRDDLTVVLLPDGDAGKRIVDAAAEWTRAGVVAPAVWAQVGSFDVQAAVPELPAVHLDPEGAHQVDLLTFLGGRLLSLLRVLAVAPVGLGAFDGAQFLGRAADVAQTVADAFPTAVADESAPSTRVRRLLLLVPASGVADRIPRDAVARWHRVLVVAPESRRSPSHANQYVRDGEELADHAAACAAAVGALWTGSTHGPFDEPGSAASVAGTALVVRPFVRAVMAGGTADAIADEVIEQAATDPAALAAGQAGRARTARPQALLTAVRQYLLGVDDGALTLRAAPRRRVLPRRQVGFGKACHDWLVFAGTALVLPWQVLLRLFRRKVETVATNVVYGEDGDREIRFRPADPVLLAADVAQQLNKGAAAALARVDDEDVASLVRPHPRVWQALRESLLGLLDGRLPEGFSPWRTGTDVEVVPDRLAVAPEPGTCHQVDAAVADLLGLVGGERTLTPFDDARTYLHRLRLRLALDHVVGAVTSPAPSLDAPADPESDAAANRDPDEAAARLRAELGAPPALSAGEAHWLRAGLTDDDARSLPDASVADGSTVDDARVLVAEHARVQEWLQRRASLVDEIVVRVGEDTREARRRYRSTLAAVTPDGVDVDRIVRARRGFLRRYWLVVGAAVATVVAWSGLAAQWGSSPSRVALPFGATVDATQVAVAVLGVLGVLLTGSVLAYGRAHSQLDRHVEGVLRRQDEAADQAVEAKRELHRLAAVSAQLTDWAEIVARIVHEPWGRPEHSAKHRPSHKRLGTPPPVLLSSPVPGAGAPMAARRVAVRELLAVGWLHRAYDEACARAVGDALLTDGDPQKLLDADSPTTPNGARGQLLASLRSGQLDGPLRDAARSAVARGLDARLLGESAGDVQDSAGDGGSAAQFFAPLLGSTTVLDTGFWTDDALLRRRHCAVGTVVDATPNVPGIDGAGVEVRQTMRPPARGSLIAGAVRYDVSEPVSLGDLRLFSTTPAAPADPLADDEFYGA